MPPMRRRSRKVSDRPVFITHYPTEIKAFYMKPDPSRPEVVLCADLIAPEGYGEIIGGSQRIDDPTLLDERFQTIQLSRENYAWYMDLQEIRDCSPFRIWIGSRTDGSLDLRFGSRPGDDPFPPDVEPTVSVKHRRVLPQRGIGI